MIRVRRSCPLALPFLVALALPLGAVAQPFRRGPEFQVNTVTSFVQKLPSLSSDADGDFVVVWQSYHDGSGAGVFGQRFSSAGVAQAVEFQVNTHFTTHQFDAAVAADADGDFVVVWTSRDQDGGAFYGVFAQRFSSTGGLVGVEFHVNSYTLGNQIFPTIATDADGDFVVAWTSAGQDGAGYAVFARRFSSDGVSQALEFQVSAHTISDQAHPWADSEGDGDFIVVWTSRQQDGEGYGVFAQRFSSAGTTQAGEFQVNTYTGSYQSYPSVALTPDGGFVVAWQSYGQAGSGWDIFARPFSSAGGPLASEFQVNLRTQDYQRRPVLATDADAGFVIVWQSNNQDGDGHGVFGRLFSSDAAPSTGEFQVNLHTQSSQDFPALAPLADGDFVVAWESYGQDGANQGIFAQRFKAEIALDIDGDGTTQALTDGILVLRFLFGFTGGVLVAGAVDPACTRCDAAAIEPYLDLISDLLNVDGNPEKDALTDGLLVIRFLFGFTGNQLINGAVGENCTRCDAPSIEDLLAAHSV